MKRPLQCGNCGETGHHNRTGCPKPRRDGPWAWSRYIREQQPATTESTGTPRRGYHCRNCGKPGHNQRNCIEAPRAKPLPVRKTRHPDSPRRRKFGERAIDHKLGTMSDGALAREEGLSAQRIHQLRAMFNIPRFVPPPTTPPPAKGLWAPTREFVVAFLASGPKTRAEIGELFGAHGLSARTTSSWLWRNADLVERVSYGIYRLTAEGATLAAEMRRATDEPTQSTVDTPTPPQR